MRGRPRRLTPLAPQRERIRPSVTRPRVVHPLVARGRGLRRAASSSVRPTARANRAEHRRREGPVEEPARLSRARLPTPAVLEEVPVARMEREALRIMTPSPYGVRGPARLVEHRRDQHPRHPRVDRGAQRRSPRRRGANRARPSGVSASSGSSSPVGSPLPARARCGELQVDHVADVQRGVRRSRKRSGAGARDAGGAASPRRPCRRGSARRGAARLRRGARPGPALHFARHATVPPERLSTTTASASRRARSAGREALLASFSARRPSSRS